MDPQVFISFSGSGTTSLLVPDSESVLLFLGSILKGLVNLLKFYNKLEGWAQYLYSGRLGRRLGTVPILW